MSNADTSWTSVLCEKSTCRIKSPAVLSWASTVEWMKAGAAGPRSLRSARSPASRRRAKRAPPRATRSKYAPQLTNSGIFMC